MVNGDLEQTAHGDACRLVGTCAIEVRRRVTPVAHSFETSIKQLRGLTDDKLHNHQVCTANVRML